MRDIYVPRIFCHGQTALYVEVVAGEDLLADTFSTNRGILRNKVELFAGIICSDR
jgi:hypothetical protein